MNQYINRLNYPKYKLPWSHNYLWTFHSFKLINCHFYWSQCELSFLLLVPKSILTYAFPNPVSIENNWIKMINKFIDQNKAFLVLNLLENEERCYSVPISFYLILPNVSNSWSRGSKNVFLCIETKCILFLWCIVWGGRRFSRHLNGNTWIVGMEIFHNHKQ